MAEKIRIGNDIDVRWSLIDAEGQPYNLEGRDVAIEIEIGGKKRYRVSELDVSGNTVHFVYWGKDQKYTGPCDLKFIENNGEREMVTFDTQEAFTLVSHSWLAVDPGELPETIQIEVVTLASNLMERVGPKGDNAGFGTIDAEVDANVGVPSVVVVTSGPDTAKNIHFSFRNLKGETGAQGPIGPEPVITIDAEGRIYADGVLLSEVLKNAVDRANDVSSDMEEYNAHPPRINGATDHWEIWDVVNHVYVDTGVNATNVPYATFNIDLSTGSLIMTYSTTYAGPTFSLNRSNGNLQITI